jgi:Fungal specific transcription factor domain
LSVLDNPLEDITDTKPRRLPSPFLLADFSFREDLLIDHYLHHLFKRQVKNNAIKATIEPSSIWIRNLISATPSLRHSVCALAALTYPTHPKPAQKEILAHRGMALLFLRKSLVEGHIDEGVLLAILELIDYEVFQLEFF